MDNKNYWFVDKLTGEEFFAQVKANETKQDAYALICKAFGTEYTAENIKCVRCVDDEYAERMGLDTY